MGYIIGTIIFIIIMFFASGLLGATYFIYLPFKKRLLKSNRLNKKQSKRIDKLYIIAVLIIGFYVAWIGFFPNDGFYKSIFESNTMIEFPNSGIIIAKDSDFPDHFGDYWAAAIAEIATEDFENIHKKIEENPDFQMDTSYYGIGIGVDFENLAKDLKMEDIELTYVHKKKSWFKIAFSKDKKTIVFERNSS